jgi:hypothetical protein
LLEFNLPQDIEKKKAESMTPHFLNLNQDIVGWSQKRKCGLKYVIHTPCGLLDICNKKAEPKLRQVSLGNE